ncbi:ras-domain-containing protein [Penicillium hispanicum]|uniref:ras-domain-containing protein n=1 Tax=Penicillium hispanicum TaxID=1080232 RepID=UPI002542424D|nr:ras-domain-containing protein [Penicillium hispanicum]KAJ5594515.1 ras-domain-containing protein [Penicillium hispanicum]
MADKISITICGDGGCDMIPQLVSFPFSYECHDQASNAPFPEDSYSVTRTVDGLPYFLSITDTAGQEEYRGLWTASTLKSDAFLLVYDITNPSSLETLDDFTDMINMEAEQRLEDNECLRKELGPKATAAAVGLPPPVKIVAGNKCDLKDGRAVSSREGLEYARKHGCGFMETSAREMVNIEETFACRSNPPVNRMRKGHKARERLNANDHHLVLVRRVVEARRMHNQPGAAPTGPPPSRAGQSVHTTALPQTTTDASNGGAYMGRPRRSQFLGIGKGRKMAKPDVTELKEEEEVEPRGCLFQRLCCYCCCCCC